MERKINHPKRFLWLSALLVVGLFGACHFEKTTLNGDGSLSVGVVFSRVFGFAKNT